MDASVDSAIPRTAVASAAEASSSPRTPRSPRCAVAGVVALSVASLLALNQTGLTILLHLSQALNSNFK